MSENKAITRIGGLIVATAAIGYGISWWNKNRVLAEHTKITTSNFGIKKVYSTSSAELTLDIGILNRTDMDLSITGYNLSIFLNNNYIGYTQSKLMDKYSIRSGQKVDVPVSIMVNPAELLKYSTGILNSKINMRGKVNIQKGIFMLSIPIDYELPEIKTLLMGFVQSLL